MGSLRWDIVQRLLPGSAGTTVLEVGCGQGAVAARLAERYDYLGVELDPASARTAADRLRAGGRGEVRHGDLSVVTPDQTFDLVVAFEVIEHIEDDVAALAEWVQRVTPGGRLIISTPAYQRRYGTMDELVGHFRRYEPAALEQLLRDAGLEEVTVSHYGVPLIYVIEPIRNVIARRRLGRPGASGAADTLLPGGTTGVAAGHQSSEEPTGSAQPVESPASAEALDAPARPAPTVMAERTATSGRTLQPGGRAAGMAIQTLTAPMKVLQRRFPAVGPLLVAHGRRPAS